MDSRPLQRVLELPTQLVPQPKEKDALMEALDDIDDNGWDDDDGNVIFDGLGPTTNVIDVQSLSTAPVADLSTVKIDVSTPTNGGAMETDVKLLDTPSDVDTPNLTLETLTTPVVADKPSDTGLEDGMVDLDERIQTLMTLVMTMILTLMTRIDGEALREHSSILRVSIQNKTPE